MECIYNTYEDIHRFCSSILESGVVHIGLDTETSISDYDDNRISVDVLAISTANTVGILCIGEYACMIFKDGTTESVGINPKIWPKSLIKLLSTPNIIKTGVDISTDAKKLKDMGLELRNFIDIQHQAKILGIPQLSLRKLATRIEGYPGKEKKDILRLSNWSSKKWLTENHIRYVCNDVIASRLLFYVLSGVPQKFEYPKNIKFSSDIPPKDIDESLNNNGGKTDLIDLVEFIAKYITAQPRNISIDKHSNYIFNSFSKWRSLYNDMDRRNKIKDTVYKILELNLIPNNRYSGHYIVPALQNDANILNSKQILDIINNIKNNKNEEHVLQNIPDELHGEIKRVYRIFSS